MLKSAVKVIVAFIEGDGDHMEPLEMYLVVIILLEA
jgi:hypothetical protein